MAPDITAGLVKELRSRTGAGMMNCKKALAETSGDLDKAVDYLRTKGMADAKMFDVLAQEWHALHLVVFHPNSKDWD